MFNKKIWVSAIVIIIILLVIGGIVLKLGKVKENLINQNRSLNPENKKSLTDQTNLTKEGYNNLSAAAMTPLLEDSFLGQLRNTYTYVENLDKSKCSELEEEYFRNNCINGIDLMERAKKENNSNICFNRAYNVDVNLRVLCANQFEVKND